MKIFWAMVKAYVYTLRSPLKYRMVSQTHVILHRDAVCEEISFIGVMEDKPDVTPHSIIHKLVPIKTYYGDWHESD